MDTTSRMEQFWDDNSSLRGHLEHGHNAGGSIISTGIGGSCSGHNQYDRNLNFATGAVEDNEYPFAKKKSVRDPLSHRIIEKRRRDRMNNCLADLARLLPPSSLRKGRGRIEKTEIVELAIKHLRHLQNHPCPLGDKCEFNYIVKSSSRIQENFMPNRAAITKPSNACNFPSTPEEQFRLGFQECISESMHFLVEEEGMYPGDSLCVRILKHLGNHSEIILKEHFGNDGKQILLNEIKKENNITSKSQCDTDSPDFNNGNSSSSGYQANGSSSTSDGIGGQDTESPESLPIPSSNCASRAMTDSIDYDGENSCCSTQLSLDISDVYSIESKSTERNSNKPPIPAIICSGSARSSSPSGLFSSNGRSSDEGHETGDGGSNCSNSTHRYKFKNNIKQRFVADLVVPCSDNHDQIEKLDDDCDFNSNKSYSTKAPKEIETHKVQMATLASSRKIAISNTMNEISQPNITIKAPVSTTLVETQAQNTKKSECIESTDFKTISNSTDQDGENTRDSTSAKPTIEESCLFYNRKRNVGRVPAFALHDEGLYYIPLTIDKSLLTPYLVKMDTNSVPPPLHPVTISVCFLLSPGDKSRINSHLQKDPIPISSSSLTSMVSTGPACSGEKLPLIPTGHPVITPTPTTPLQLSPGGISTLKASKPRPTEHANNFVLNRNSQSQSRSYSSVPLPLYQIPGGRIQSSVPSILPSPQNLTLQKDLLSHQQYYPGFFSADCQSFAGLVPVPSSNLNGGYSSSSSSSASSIGNHGRQSSRKRSIANLSPISGSGSLGYHSFNSDKYSPSSQSEFFQSYASNQYPSSSSGSSSHSQSHTGPIRGAMQPSGPCCGINNITVNKQHYPDFGGYRLNNGHLVVPFGRDDKQGEGHFLEKRSLSPTKKIKRGRDTDDILKSNSQRRTIPLPANQ